MAEQVLTGEWIELPDTGRRETFSLQNLGRYNIRFVTASAAPAAGISGKVLFPRGHYLSVGSATPDSGESIWAIAEGGGTDPVQSLLEYT